MKIKQIVSLIAVVFCLASLPQTCKADLIKVNTKTIQQELKNHSVVMIKFGTSWCPSCIAMKDIDNIITTKFTEVKNKKKFIFLEVDGDAQENQELLKTYKIQGFPTYCLLKTGEIIKTLVGMQNQNTLESEINTLLKK